MTSNITLTEIRSFRLFLVTIGFFLVISGLIWGYSEIGAYTARKEAIRYTELASQGVDRCMKQDPQRSYESCVNAAYSHLSDMYASDASEHEDRASIALWFVWLPPIILGALFYSIRWALTGRMRPLWLLKRGQLERP